MKSLQEIINENLTNKQTDIVGDLLFQMFEGTKLSKDDIFKLFKNVDIEIIKKLENYITNRDNKNSLAYMAQNDDFLDKSKHTHIIEMFAEYVHKYISNNQVQ